MILSKRMLASGRMTSDQDSEFVNEPTASSMKESGSTTRRTDMASQVFRMEQSKKVRTPECSSAVG